MFEFKGTAAEGSGNDCKVLDHRNFQDLGKRPFIAMRRPAHHQRTKTEGAKRPSLQIRSRSNSSVPIYSRPQDRDDLSPVTTSFDSRTPRSLVDRRSVSGGSIHTRGDSSDGFTRKALMAKGSRFLKRQNSKQELTSLRTLDWVEESESAHVRRLIDERSPPHFRHSRTWSIGDSNAAPRLNISEPFNFHHVTHTQPHHAQKLERVDPNDLVSEFSALRASQTSQPGLRGIKATDIKREELPRDALLPDSPSHPQIGSAGLSSFCTSRIQDHAQGSPYSAMSPVRTLDQPRSTDNFSQPSAAYHDAQNSPTSSSPRALSRHRTPDFFTFHHKSPSEATFDLPIPTEPPSEPSNYSVVPWNDGVYDFASPHAVTTDDGADWNRQVPFSMVKTDLAPVEEDDENDEKRSSILTCTQRSWTHKNGPRNTQHLPSLKVPLHKASNTSRPAAQRLKGGLIHAAHAAQCRQSTRPVAEEEDVLGSLHSHSLPPAKVSEPFIEDPLDDIPVRPRFSRHVSVGPRDMAGFWDIASDAINCSYALGAEGDSHFDWCGSSIYEDDASAPIANDIQAVANDTISEPPNGQPQTALRSSGGISAKRSSSVYSSSPPLPLPLQTFPFKPDPLSAGSTQSSFSSVTEAVTPSETTEAAMNTRFSTSSYKEWCQPAYIVPNDGEYQTLPDELYHNMYTSDYSPDAPFQLHNVGRIEGSTMNNSPRSSRSPISKSSSQESFLYAPGSSQARRPRNAGSIGSLPELMSSKNSRERFDSAVDQSTDNPTFVNTADSPSDSQQATTAQRRRSPNLAKDAAQNIMLSKVRSAEEPVPQLPASRDRAISDVPLPTQDSSMPPPPPQPTTSRRKRSGSSASSLNARSSRGSYNVFPLPNTAAVLRNL